MILARAILALWLALLAGCLAPPALIGAVDVDFAKAVARYPSGTEALELEVGDGERLEVVGDHAVCSRRSRRLTNACRARTLEAGMVPHARYGPEEVKNAKKL